MTKAVTSLRGMHDIPPDITPTWQHIEHILRQQSLQFGYQEIRMPLVEDSALFCRTIGEQTDIVNKEMYTFDDKSGSSITLRPEGTAGCVRAMIQQSLLRKPGQKVWYMGPMFRYERPQKGRARQFHQFGVETFGLDTASIAIELISFCHTLWHKLAIEDTITLEINSLGTTACREHYKQALVAYFEQHLSQLTDEEQQRLRHNPLRLLDSKNPTIKALLADAPNLADSLSKSETECFQTICTMLDQLGIAYTINPYLVRGLDYYNGLVFEWTTEELGAQGTICAGGRYDHLVELIGKNTQSSAIGFALGLERLVALLPHSSKPASPTLYVVSLDPKHDSIANHCAHIIRSQSSYTCLQSHTHTSVKNHFKRVSQSGAQIAVIIGDDEALHKTVTLKFMQSTKPQQTIPIDSLISTLHNIL